MKTYKFNKLFQFLFPFFFIVGITLIILGINNKKAIELTATPYDTEPSYKVCLKPNNYFEEKCLEEGRTYIASLIDYIEVQFNYNISYNMPIDSDFTYKYVAIVRANQKSSNGYYWEKEYDLTEEKKINTSKEYNISVGDTVRVDYATYNEQLSNFKKEYGINTDGELKVVMRIKNTVKYEQSDESATMDFEPSLSIPLLEQSLQLNINKDSSSAVKIFTFEEEDANIKYLVFRILGLILVVASLYGLIDAIIYNLKFKKKNKYELELNNILKNYDSIIANTSDLSSIESMKKIEISNFQELLDVYNEVRMPINYYQDSEKKESTFVIVNDRIAWIYTLRKRVDNNGKK